MSQATTTPLENSATGISRYLLLVFIGCWLGGVFDGMDSTLMSVVLPVAVKDLIGTADPAQVGKIGSYISTVFLLGWTLGGIVFGFIGDKLGRVRSMILSILLYALFTGLAGLAQTWPQLAACRFLTGLGIGGELVSIATFLTEVWPARSRAVAVGVLITSYQAGVFLAGGINFLLADWRSVFFVGAAPALLVLFIRFAMKESDRWLADQEKQLQLEAGGEAVSHLKTLFCPENRRSLLVGAFAFGGLLVGYWASLAWIPTWIQSLVEQTPGLTAGGSERSIATMAQGLAAVAGCSSAGFLADKFGRRPTLMLGYLGCFGASAWMFLTNPVFSDMIYGQSALLGYFIGLAQAAMYVYLPELFPTRVRATGTGFCLNAGRLVTAVAVFFVGSLVALLGGYGQAAFVFSFSYLVAVAACALGAETRGQGLRE